MNVLFGKSLASKTLLCSNVAPNVATRGMGNLNKYKLKTKSAAAKRYTITPNGKVKCHPAKTHGKPVRKDMSIQHFKNVKSLFHSTKHEQ